MNSQPSTLAAIYRRVSTDHQDGSLELQERRVLDYAAFKGLTISDGLAFSDPDTSGGTPMLDRTGGRALLNRLKLGDVKHLIVAKLDRLGRNVRDALGVLEYCEEHGIVLHIADFGGDAMSTQGHMGRLIITVLLAVAEWELGEIQDRTQKRMDSKFAANELCGNVPYGFDAVYKFADGSKWDTDEAKSVAELAPWVLRHGAVISKQLEPNAQEQANIRLMKELRDITTTPPGGIGQKIPMSYTAIAEQMNHRGYKTKQGKPWGCGNVRSVLTSRHTARLLSGGASVPASRD
jgi:DNA invertase Pin-like site-specific DNA recombinase